MFCWVVTFIEPVLSWSSKILKFEQILIGSVFVMFAKSWDVFHKEIFNILFQNNAAVLPRFACFYFIVPPFDYSFTFLFFYYDHASTLDRIWACRASHTCVRLLFRFFRIRSLFFACCRFCLRSWSPGREVEKQARFWPEVEFVNAVAAGGSENFFARGVNFSRNKAIYNIDETTKYILISSLKLLTY